MYKVFINTNILFISRNPLKSAQGLKKVQNIPFSPSVNLKRIITKLEEPGPERQMICLYHEDLALLWKKYRKHYGLVRAGGGLVRNHKGKFLFIFRNGKWDLPKGKADDNEPIDQTALREVKEECGFTQIEILDHLVETYHTYGPAGHKKLKKTSWYLMYSEEKNLVPQTEEGITKIKWIRAEKLEKVWRNTYPSVVDVVDAELAKLEQPVVKVKWHANVNFE